MPRFPALIRGEGFLLRQWRLEDAARQQQAIAESDAHLRPWMPWMADEPLTLEQRRALLASWRRVWEEGGDANYAVLVDRVVAGSCGLYRRLGPRALEIGYWIHVTFLRRGLASTVVARLTDTAFAQAGIDSVEIHHDRANLASAGVPPRLGYRLVGEQPNEAPAPSDTGIDRVWRVERSEWRSGGWR